MLSVINCSKLFAGLKALDQVSLQVQAGEMFGLIGPNGAGKTTFFNLISGVYKPSGGVISFKDVQISGLSPTQVCRLGISRTFQVPKPFIELTVLQNVMVGTTMKRSISDGKKVAREVLEFVGLDTKADFQSGDLNIPDLKRLELAKALSTDPQVILLDEVMAGLRPTEIREALELLKGINSRGITLVVIEHIMEAVMSICHRIAVLNYGKKICEGTPQEVACNSEVIKAYLGDEYVFSQDQ